MQTDPPGPEAQPQPVSDSPPQGQPYEGAPVAVAVLLTIFAPFISLIAALVLRSSERDPASRRQLGSWATASGVVLAVELLLAIVMFAAVLSGVRGGGDTSGPCVGGPKIRAMGEPLGNGRYRFPCTISGSDVVVFPEDANS